MEICKFYGIIVTFSFFLINLYANVHAAELKIPLDTPKLIHKKTQVSGFKNWVNTTLVMKINISITTSQLKLNIKSQ